MHSIANLYNKFVLTSFLSKLKYNPLIALGVFLIGFGASYLTLTIAGTSKSKEQTPTPFTEEPQASFEPIDIKESYNVVLLGSGGEGHSGGTLTDSIIVVSVDPKNKKASLVSIPRDLWVPGNHKINAEVHINGVGGLKGALQGITGLEVENHVSIDFNSLIALIDELGGVEVDIPRTFDDYFYPIKGKENETCGLSPEEIASAHQKYSGFELEKQFTCRWEHVHFDKGISAVSGEEALKLARSRHGDSDFGRSSRQFAILKGILGKLVSSGSFEKIDETYKTLTKLIDADIDLKTVRDLARLFGNPSDYKINEVHLSTQNVLNEGKSSDGQYILVPKAGNFNFTAVKSFISGQ
jgi:anionic cell wall polymer biosynthesis LytR-Cps2A-Psr (LCP) family protein